MSENFPDLIKKKTTHLQIQEAQQNFKHKDHEGNQFHLQLLSLRLTFRLTNLQGRLSAGTFSHKVI